MKCLLLTRYSRMGASSRMRHLQYLPELAAAGIEVEVRHLLGDGYLQALYAGAPRSRTGLAGAYLRRLLDLTQAGRYDLVWLEKELFPFAPGVAERLLLTSSVPYVVDYDDASFHTYDLNPSRVVRSLLGQKIDTVMRHAALVVAGNAYLAGRARQAGARRVEVLPTVVDLDQYPWPAPARSDVFTIGWIGTPSTARYLHLVEDALHELARRRPFRLLVIGATAPFEGGFEIVHLPWSEDAEVQHIHRLDVGIMPLDDGPWEQGKCGYKLVQYMACGRPVVASPVGVNREIVREGENGFLAADTAAWVQALETLAATPHLRERIGDAGRRRVEAAYCVQVTAPRLAQLLYGSTRHPEHHETAERRG